jgi:hypothetical protein
MMELLLIGLLLSIMDRGVATLRGAHRTLVEGISLDDRLALGSYRKVEEGVFEDIKLRDLVHQNRRIREGLAYGALSTPHLDDAERERRRKVVTDFSNAVMDAFDLGFDGNVMALDATGIWSWARGGKRRKPVDDEEFTEESDEVRLAIAKLCASGEYEAEDVVAVMVEQSDSFPPALSRRRRTLVSKERMISQGKDLLGDDGLGYTLSIDPDGDWGVKTAKSGGRECFFGYDEHTLVLAPATRVDEDPTATPVLIRRLELTPAGKDIVDVSKRLLDSLGAPPTDLLVDSHYHYKAVDRWKDWLASKGINQHHTLHPNEQGFALENDVLFAAGAGHCCATPIEFGTIPRPAPNASSEDFAVFHARIDLREAYAARVKEQPNAAGSTCLECPALSGKVGCQLRAGTMAAARAAKLPKIENPPKGARHELPKICTQKSVTMMPSPAVRKLQQPYYWGSKKWEKFFGRRTAVEGSYGNRKNVSTENMRRGIFQSMGLPWANVVITLTAASYNTRMIQNWHDRSGQGDPNHPLLRMAPRGRSWNFLTPKEVAERERVYLETFGR